MAEERSGPPRGAVLSRRHGSALEQAILTAAAELLAESGYAGLTMDAVARRAGTNKNTLYRRWAGRAELGVAAYQQVAEDRPAVPDTGSLRGDCIELLRRAGRDLCSPRGEILRSLLDAARAEPALLAQLRHRFDESGTAMWLTVLGRAVARGEAAPEVLHPRVAATAFTLLRDECLARGNAVVPDGVIVEIIDEVYLPLVRGRSHPPFR
ncbi:MAG TPA: TetR/AcrR family transcriptional regulator [Actinocrinis sp.]|jgi:AcrR family transcriptional regulator